MTTKKIFLITSLFTDPDPPVRVAGRIGKLVSLVKVNWILIFCEKGEEPNSDSDLASKVQLGVVGLRHDRWHHSRPHRHTAGGGKFLKHRLD